MHTAHHINNNGRNHKLKFHFNSLRCNTGNVGACLYALATELRCGSIPGVSGGPSATRSRFRVILQSIDSMLQYFTNGCPFVRWIRCIRSGAMEKRLIVARMWLIIFNFVNTFARNDTYLDCKICDAALCDLRSQHCSARGKDAEFGHMKSNACGWNVCMNWISRHTAVCIKSTKVYIIHFDVGLATTFWLWCSANIWKRFEFSLCVSDGIFVCRIPI